MTDDGGEELSRKESGGTPQEPEEEAPQWLRELMNSPDDTKETTPDAAAPKEETPLDGIPWLRDLLETPAPPEQEKPAQVPEASPVPEEGAAAQPQDGSESVSPAEEFTPLVEMEDAPPREDPRLLQSLPEPLQKLAKKVRTELAPLPEAVELSDTGEIPEGPVEVPLPPSETRFGGKKNHRTWAELRRNRKKNLKTPDYYDGAGKDEPFRINFDFALEYRSPVRHRAIRRSTIRRTGWVGGLMYFAFILCISLTAASIGWLAASDVLGLGKPTGEITVTIPDDFTVDDVSEILFANGLIKYQKLFKLYGTYSHAEEKIDAGTYTVRTNYDYRALVYGLSASEGIREEIEVTIPEGYNLDQIVSLLAEQGVCTAQELLDAAADGEFEYDFLEGSAVGDPYRLEGFLFPDTYMFYKDDEPDRVLEKFLDDFDYRFTEEMREQAALLGRSVREIVTVASLIEKEAAGDSERGDISSVIYNRLASPDFPYLQLDCSVIYAAARMGVPFDITLDSPYNTYVTTDLPAGPIANPGLTSINAALSPHETAYYYFLLNTEQKTVFFETYEEFAAFLESDEYGG